MSKTPQPIAFEDARGLLIKAPEISVIVIGPNGQAQPELWSQVRAEAFLRMHGAVLSGPEARRLHHGIAALGPDNKQYLFETGHTQPGAGQ